jgi:hypothetical protein
LGVFGMKAEMAKLELDPYAGDCCVLCAHWAGILEV